MAGLLSMGDLDAVMGDKSDYAHDMGKGGSMTQAQIDKKFKELMAERWSLGAMLSSTADAEVRRKLVKMELNEPTPEEVKEIIDMVKLRVKQCVDDEDHGDNWTNSVGLVPAYVEKHKGKIVSYIMTACVAHDTNGRPATSTVGSIAGNVVNLEKVLVKHTLGHLKQMAKELDITWEEALDTYTARLKSERYGDKIDEMLIIRTAEALMHEESEAGRAPEDNPALAHVLVDLMKNKFKDRVTMEGGAMEALKKLAEGKLGA